ncbi:MAG: RiPP maturation radical SAM protein 1 [Desulfobulbaceae bacterium]|nr:RiPP maturation radical SAM protein 1 [Desulfobulbaceae bacterium]
MNNTSPFRVALISMPWSIFNRPSIQLATLKSYLNTQDRLHADSFHPYLHIAKLIGLDLYREIAHRGWAGEALFAPLLFAEKYDDSKSLFHESLQSTLAKANKDHDFDLLVAKLDEFCKNWLLTTDLASYDLVGISVCFSQLLPSLYLARLIRKRHPYLPIVFGGSSCSSELGNSLVQQFKEVDFVVNGEGESVLSALCQFLAGESKELPKNIYSKNNFNDQRITRQQSHPLKLNDLPRPDFGDYFNEMRLLFPQQLFIPVLPLEFSRGCWWNKCSFCNLNIQWPNYRFKSGEKMARETLALSSAYESLHFTFTDNALPPKEADYFFKEIKSKKIDFDFFAEIRAVTEPHRLELYRQAGLSTVQVGIEAFSTSLLQKMEKGTSAIENMAVMKMCSQYGILMEGNVIVEFPTTSEEEISETIQNLDFVLPYAPLESATFFLGFGSPIYNQYHNFSITSILPHSKNRKLFPPRYLSSLTMLLNSYRGDRKQQQKRWKPVRDKIKRWKQFHTQRTSREHPLSYRDGKTFLIIRQELNSGPPLQHRLRGLSRKIYLACQTVTELSLLCDSFPQVKKEALEKFIADMCEKRLMFQEQERVLSLAIPARNNN